MPTGRATSGGGGLGGYRDYEWDGDPLSSLLLMRVLVLRPPA